MENEKDMTQTADAQIDESEVCVCFNLRKAARVITHIYDEVMRPLGYRATQIQLLGIISRHDAITVKDLAEFTDIDPTTLLRNLRLLEREKLVDLEVGKDRRERVVMLRSQGHELLGKAYPIWKETQDKLAKLVGKERLNNLLHDLSDALEKMK